MPVYVALYKMTDQGRKEVKTMGQRMQEARTAAERAGMRVIGSYVTMGEYDAVAIVEAPNDEAVAVGAVRIVANGNFVSTTMRAFTPEEFTKIAQNL